MRKLLLALFLTVSFGLYAQDEANTANSTPDVPSIKLKNVDGEEVDLQKLTSNGKVTIISFWATWCGPCKKELDNMSFLLEEWKEQYDVQLVAISIDDSRNALKVKPFVEGKKWDFEVLLDVNQDTKRALNYPNVPYTMLVDKNGKVVYKHTGYTEGDEFVLEDKIKELK